MRIERKAITELTPAPYNPRKISDKDYEDLKRSLSEFGYVEPIIWNEQTGRVVGGHQRLKALSEAGEKEIECVIVNLDEAREKALNITLNKVSGDWDEEKLSALLEDLKNTDIDITLTGFDLEDIDAILEDEADDDDGYFGDEREKTYDEYRLNEYDAKRTAGYYQFPMLKASHYVPDELTGFNYVKSYKSDRAGVGIHFFLDDYQFARIWNNPYENIERLRGFSCVLTPDYSLYLDMPLAMKIWNVYRSRLIGQLMQDTGFEVIPTLQWAEAETYKFCFDGIESGGVVAVSTVGVMQDRDARKLWYSGMDEAIKRLKPECVLCYGAKIDYDFGDVPVKYYERRKFTGG